MNINSSTAVPLLSVSHLSVGFPKQDRTLWAVDNISFQLNRGEILGLVGESGSGKTLTALSVLGLLPYPLAIHSPQSSIRLNGTELIHNPDLRRYRGSQVGYIFQEPMSSLNPLHTIEHQISETIMLHQGLSRRQARRQTLKLLKLTGLTNARYRLNAYPHQLSGGQRQRVMIAMAIANKPQLLIADEPTTALDVTIQAQIITLLLKLQKQFNMAILFISHDLNLVRKIADKVVVMHQGKIIESGTTEEIFQKPQTNYTKALINPFIGLKSNKNIVGGEFFEVKELGVRFPLKRNFWGTPTLYLDAVKNITLTLRKGETLGIVGESGSGKSTLALACAKLVPAIGKIMFNETDLNKLSSGQLQPYRRQIQIVFQDPYNSLNPRMNIRQIIGEGLLVHHKELSKNQHLQLIKDSIAEVGLSETDLDKYPHQFSGGQRQRIALARALILHPQLLILDEPTSALDVTIQAQIIELLQEIQQQHHLTYLFISHDMRAVRAVSDRVAVMKDGRIIEQGTTSEIFERPQQDYTRNLIRASL